MQLGMIMINSFLLFVQTLVNIKQYDPQYGMYSQVFPSDMMEGTKGNIYFPLL